MAEKAKKMKTKYTKMNSDGEAYMDSQLFQSLKKEQTVVCYNEEERRSHLLEFFCCLCNRHCKGLKSGETHWSSQKHKKHAFGYRSKIKNLNSVHTLTPEEDFNLTELLRSTVQDVLMTEADFMTRKNVCQDVEETIKATGVFDVRCQLYGSSYTKIGIKNANVNIDIIYDLEKISTSHPQLESQAEFLIYVFKAIKNSDKFCEVLDLFHVSTPKFTFTHVVSGLKCVVCPQFKPGVKTCKLIKDYIGIDCRVKILCVAFRLWASVCGMDDVDGGSLSPYCYTMMAIHFLQQIEPPVLPVIIIDFRADYCYLPNNIKYSSKNLVSPDKIQSWQSDNNMSVGNLWVRLFRYYITDFFFKTLVVNITQHPPMTKQVRGLNSRKISIEDPHFSRDNAANSLVSSAVMDYFMNCLEKSYRHYSLSTEPDKGDKVVVPDSPSKSERKKKGEKRRSREEKRSAELIENENKAEQSHFKEDMSAKGKDKLHFLKEGSQFEGAKVCEDDETLDKKKVSVIFPPKGEEISDSDSDDQDDNDIMFHDSDVQGDSDDSHDDGDFADADDNDKDSDIQNYVENSETEQAVYSETKAGKEHSTDSTHVAAMDTEVSDGNSACPEGKYLPNDDTSHANHLAKGYESQYDGDVESQDDSRLLAVEGHETESSVFSDHDDQSNLQSTPGKVQPRVKSVSSNDDIVPNTPTNSVDISSNIDNLCIRGHEVSEGLNTERLVESLLFEIIGKVDSQINIEKHTDNLESDISRNEAEKLSFSFERNFLTPARRVPLHCKICNCDGHRSSECSSMGVGDIVPLEKLPKYFFVMLTKVCFKIFEDNKLTNREKQNRKKILDDVERHLKNYLDPSVRLALFGSSVNNFGFQGSNRGRSDMDICMRMKYDEPPDGLDYGSEIVKVSKALDKNPNFQKVMYIRSAKVPIVKFTIRDMNLEGDISLYNCLALKNSTMLRDYSIVDNRVRVLGYCIKVFAKLCEIGDASRGSLSSYAYILLMFYYLQRCEPPVIPVLQELYDHTKRKPISMIEGWNTWYYDDIKQLPSVWQGYNKNKQTVGELWLGFFVFYIETFDFTKNVVSMKQINTLSKFEKNWTRSIMAIEDPYNLQHNLGAGISRNMFKYLLGCFRNARSHFGTLGAKLVERREHATEEFLMGYFFNQEQLTDNKLVPKDRLCHRCGRIGHTAANCVEKIVADRERRRHDSEMTYSSENGDSDGNSKGKKGLDVKCYGCKKRGHYVVNCPENSKGSKGKRRNLKDGPSRDGPSTAEANKDLHPQEKTNLVTAKSEMTHRDGDPRQRSRDKGKKLKTKAKDLSIVNDLFHKPNLVDPMLSTNGSVNNAVDHNFQFGLHRDHNSHLFRQHSSPGALSPTKGPVSLLPSPIKTNGSHENAAFGNLSEFPALGSLSTTNNSVYMNPVRTVPPGYIPVSTAVQGDTKWLPLQSPGYTHIGQGTTHLNRAYSVPNTLSPTTPNQAHKRTPSRGRGKKSKSSQ